MDISICFADFPTEPIADTTRAFRQLGIGYANLGALLMATGHAYDSEGGRALAAAITSLMTGAAYKRSAELAGCRRPVRRLRAQRRAAPAGDAQARRRERRRAHVPGERRDPPAGHGRLARGARDRRRSTAGATPRPRCSPRPAASPADTLVTTDRGLARLGEIGDVYGDRWQDLAMTVSTDEGPRRATKFFVNGEEPTRRIVTDGGYTHPGHARPPHQGRRRGDR